MKKLFLLACLAAAPLFAVKTGLTLDPDVPKEWPRSVRVAPGFEVKAVKEDPSTGTYIYQTPHFEYHADVKLGISLVRDFSNIFEATLLVVKNNPLGLNPRMKEPRYQVRLFKTREEYLKAGGVTGSAGIYTSAQRQILVPLESLNVTLQGNRATRGKGRKDNGTLVHEITHQVMHNWLRWLPTWCVEGSAEFFEMQPYRNGIFNCSQVSPKDYARGLKSFVPLKKLFAINPREWSDAVKNGTAHNNYLSAGLTCYYFVHLDGQGDGARFKQYLKIIAETGNQVQAMDALLDGRTVEQVEAELKKAFKQKERLLL